MRWRKARALSEERKNAEALGKLLPVDEVTRVWTAHILSCRRQLMGLPRKLAPALTGKTAFEIRALLEEEIRQTVGLLGGEAPA